MAPQMWLCISFLALTLGVTAAERMFRARRRAEARTRQQWFEYTMLAANRAEQMRSGR
jgi:hypothetical protein